MYRKFRSPEEKLAIIKECQSQGVVQTRRKYSIDVSSYYAWLRKFQQQGIEGLKPLRRPPEDPEFKKLKKENERLKRLIADKELEIQIKDSLMKKLNNDRRTKIRRKGIHNEIESFHAIVEAEVTGRREFATSNPTKYQVIFPAERGGAIRCDAIAIFS